MGDVISDLKTRYSIYVPKPLARINLGDWQKREGAGQSPKFGYAGVSIQTDSQLFVDVLKTTYIQARGGYNLQTTDLLQIAQKAVFLATPDNATVGSDGLMTLAAGAGQAPTWTLDHGDLIDVYPYNSLQLHYRVEEVQNGLFEFFRGKRQREAPSDTTGIGGVAAALFLKKDKVFNSAEPKVGSLLTAFNPFSDKGVNWTKQKGAKETETTDDLTGGFERIAETSWQELFNSDDFEWGKAGERIAPQDVFGELGGVRNQLKGDELTAFADDADGKTTEKQLRYGFSQYFNRFDPYLLIDLDHPEVKPRFFLRFLAKLQNISVRLKRQVDVVYRIASLIKDVALMKAAINTWATVDSGFQAVQSARLQVQVWEAVGRGTRGNLGDQFTDEWDSGAGGKAWVDNQGTKEQKGKMDAYAFDWNTASKKKATLRSAAPDSSKGFAGLHGAGGQLAAGQTLTITSDAGTSYTTPPLTLPIPPKGAKISGSAGSDTFTYSDKAKVWVNIDNGATVKIDLTLTTTQRPKVDSGSVASLVGNASPLVGKTLSITTDTGSAVSVTLSAADCADTSALSAALSATFPDLTVTFDSVANKFTFQSKKYGPGASVTVAAGDAATALGLSTTKQSGASLAEVQAYVQSQINTTFSGSTTLDSSAKKLTIQSPTTGTTSTINLSESEAGVLSGLGLTTTSATGTSAKSAAKDLTAADIVALLKQASTQVTNAGVTSTKYATDDMDFSVDGTQVLITSKKEGDGSDIKVSGSMASPLGFVGETNGDVDWDHVYDDDRRQLDSFNKLDQEMLRMPDQLAALVRPATVLIKNAAGAVTKLLSISKALGKMSPLKLPQAKGAIGLVAKGGISLGTPDRLVGTGSKGIVFIADGQGGAADHAKFAAFEEIINRITSADPSTFFGAFASKDDKSLFKDRLKGVNPFKQPDKTNQAAVGFRVFSDSTVDLLSRNTANLLALGRGKNADDSVTGVGVARVAASYATEIIGREKVVIRTAKDENSNVEVIGKTITLGVWDAVDDVDRFGPADKGNIAGGAGTAGWSDATSKNLQQTSQIFAHAADQATIVVGDYMVQLRGKTSYGISKEEAQRVVDELTQTKASASQKKLSWTTKEETASAKVELLERAATSSLSDVMANLFGGDDIETVLEEWRTKANEAHSKVLHYTRAFDRASRRLARAQTKLSNVYEDDGIIISVRDTTDGKKSPNYMAKIGKPAISVSQKGITITTMADKKLTDPNDDTSQPGARITLNEDGISIMVGGKAGYRITKDYKLQLTDGANKAEVSNAGWNFQTNAQIQFSAAQKITLG